VEPTPEQLKRAVAALLPFVEAWELSLETEDVREMAYAVLVHFDSPSGLDEIDVAVFDRIAEARKRVDARREADERRLEQVLLRERDAAERSGIVAVSAPSAEPVLAELLVGRFGDFFDRYLSGAGVGQEGVVSLSVEYAEGAQSPDSYLPEIVLRVRGADGAERHLDLQDFNDMVGGALEDLAGALDTEGEATGNRDAHQVQVMEQLAEELEQRLRASRLAAPNFRRRTVGYD